MSSTFNSCLGSEFAPVALPPCRVCGRAALSLLCVLEGRAYWRCAHCQATLLADCHFPTREEEGARYQLHRNDIHDPAYGEFLNTLAAPLLERLPPRQVGLDYGCGPAPALARMLTAAGHSVHLFDPWCKPDSAALDRVYDFIVCTEVVEHFHTPQREFRTLDQLLRPGGWLAIMTSFQTDEQEFATWHYRRDPTHVTFYRASTFKCIASDLEWHCEFPARNVALLRKSERTTSLPVK